MFSNRPRTPIVYRFTRQLPVSWRRQALSNATWGPSYVYRRTWRGMGVGDAPAELTIAHLLERFESRQRQWREGTRDSVRVVLVAILTAWASMDIRAAPTINPLGQKGAEWWGNALRYEGFERGDAGTTVVRDPPHAAGGRGCASSSSGSAAPS